VSGLIRPGATAHKVWQPATRGRPTSWLGLGLEARSSRGSGPQSGDATHAPSALVARSSRAVHVHDSTMVCSPAARWWLAGDKVLSLSSWGPQGGHQVRRTGVELTRMAVRHGGGGEVSGQRRSSVGRELQWPMAMEAWPCSVGAEEGR
jgi:hypothetical protein